MRSDIVSGAVFPDYELPDHTTKRRKLSELQGQHPTVLVLSRGGYCPKDRRQHEGLLQLHRELEVVSPLTKLDRNSGPGYAVGVPFCTEGDSLCVVVSRACCPLPLPTKTVCTQPLIVTACPGIKCGGPEFCWLSLPVSASVMSPLKWNAA